MSKKTMVGRYLRSTMLSGVAAAVAAPMALVATSAILSPAAAQDYTSGAIAGNVVDASGNPVAGATVTIESLDQGFSRSATTSSQGGFRFSGLTPGNYQLTATSGGQTETVESARVAASSTANFTVVVGAAASSGDEVVVTGTRQNFDFANTTTGVNLDVESLVKEIPIGRDLTSLTLLAPGTVTGDSAFGNFSAIGGSSVAENAYYINGLNVTNFDNYIGSSIVPFEFYKSVEVKTGGYPAEYGRATGGIINAVTKSGTNEWEAGVHLNWTPDSLRSDAPDTYLARNGLDETDEFSTIIELGGPIIRDRLFVYGLVELRDNTFKDASISGGNQVVDRQKDPIFGMKVDAYPIENHHLEFTYFDTDRQTNRETYDFVPATDAIGTAVESRTTFNSGGESFVGKYTGVFTEWLTLSAAYGKNNDEFEVLPESQLNRVIDARVSPNLDLSSQTVTSIETPYITQREFYRADADLYFSLFGDHHVRMGFDKEKLYLEHVAVRTGPEVVNPLTAFPGGLTYLYRNCIAANPMTGAPETAQCDGDNVGITTGDSYVELNYFNSGGTFDAENTAYYIQDQWDVTDRLTLNLGVRWDKFANFTDDGSQFIDFDSEIAPRAGFSFDVFGDGRGRLYGNYGVYFLPVASNTAFRQGAQEWFFREYWTFSSIGVNGLPVLDQQLTDWRNATTCPFDISTGGTGTTDACAVTGSGSVQNPLSSISQNLQATKEKEIIVGYEHRLTDLWTLGLNYTHRNLVTNAEDVAIDLAVINYCNDAANGVDQSTTACSSIWTGFHQYTIINPGFDSTIVLNELLPGETELRTIDFTAEQLGYPIAKRTYDAIEFTFNRAFDGVWSLRGSYTWSRSKGNSEGYVKSDVGQDDAGITQDFDQPGLTDGSFGFLPNHRAHQIKFWGSYQVTEDLLFGVNGSVSSPRKFGCIGVHPTDVFAQAYGAASFYCNGVLTPRGESLESDWVKNLNVAVRYNIELPTGTQMTVRADVFNIFNFDGVQDLNEFGEFNNGAPDGNYGEPLSYQAPRSVRLGLDLAF